MEVVELGEEECRVSRPSSACELCDLSEGDTPSSGCIQSLDQIDVPFSCCTFFDFVDMYCH